MKVLFVISTLRAGGAERVASVLASHFALFHDTSLLKFESSASFYPLNPAVKIINLQSGADDLGALGNLKKRLSKLAQIRAVVKNGKFDAVISFMDSTNLLVLAACAGLGAKIIISEHSYHKFLSLKWRLAKRALYPLASALSVLTREDLDYYSFVPVRGVIYNPADVGETSNLNKENLIVFAGRLVPVKGCDIFLRAISNLKSRGLLGDWRVCVLGGGEERENLENLARELGVAVEFKGAVANIEKYYARARVIVLSSRFEGLGNVLIESSFFHCARVATPTAGARELVADGKNGFLAADFTPGALATKIALAMGEAGEKVAGKAYEERFKFEISEIYAQWLGLLKRAGVSNLNEGEK